MSLPIQTIILKKVIDDHSNGKLLKKDKLVANTSPRFCVTLTFYGNNKHTGGRGWLGRLNFSTRPWLTLVDSAAHSTLESFFSVATTLIFESFISAVIFIFENKNNKRRH